MDQVFSFSESILPSSGPSHFPLPLVKPTDEKVMRAAEHRKIKICFQFLSLEQSQQKAFLRATHIQTGQSESSSGSSRATSAAPSTASHGANGLQISQLLLLLLLLLRRLSGTKIRLALDPFRGGEREGRGRRRRRCTSLS